MPATRSAEARDRDSTRSWHRSAADAVLRSLGSTPHGLTEADAASRLAAHGPNLIPEAPPRSVAAVFLAQFTDFLIVILLAAAAISALLGDLEDTLAIAAIVLLNAVVGFIQEHRAERAIAALKAMAAPTATVVRDGVRRIVAGADLVPGDVVLLEAGGAVPADLRLIEAAHLRIDEAVLTGESVPIDKTAVALTEGDAEAGLGDLRNLAFKGTTVTYGRGAGAVVATGTHTELGRIAVQLEGAVAVKTPLQRRLMVLGRWLAAAALAVCALVFVVGVARGEPPMLMLLTAISLAVAAVPEALPAVVTVSLAIGARQMIAKHALVRRLPAVETLGSVTTICTDKTGTLTESRMHVDRVWYGGRVGDLRSLDDGAAELVRALALSNDACVDPAGALCGDPTETALLGAAMQAGANKRLLEGDYPRVAELPFDGDRKRMSTVHQDPHGGTLVLTKGAPEIVLALATRIHTAIGERPIDRASVAAAAERLADEGLRVLAIASRRMPGHAAHLRIEAVESDLTLLGLVGLLDPPRPGAAEAVAECRAAGIVPVMITGDHPRTAAAIARRVGIDVGGGVVTGRELAQLSPDALDDVVARTHVYARVAPEQKLAIVEALQRRGEVVAMTGDGVNDAPALKRAEIGVAMGRVGTDVAKEASAMVLLDDDFATIVRAVREGRRIYDNLRRFIRYAVTTNFAEVAVMFFAPLVGMPIPLLPIQILWINLVTDGLPGLALAAEPAEGDVMRRPPRRPDEGVFAGGLGVHVLAFGMLMTALSLTAEAWLTRAETATWQTMVFTVLCFSQLAHVLAIRSERESVLKRGLLSNRPLAAAVGLTFALQLAVVYVPALHPIFETVPLGPGELAAALGSALVVFVAVELEKWLRRRGARPETLTAAITDRHGRHAREY